MSTRAVHPSASKAGMAAMAELSEVTERNLDRQGFGGLDREAKNRCALPLRFTPGSAAILILVGLVLRSPVWLGSMAVVALSGALFPKGMLLDLVYNLFVRRLFRLPPLPPTPKPRQFSYLLSAVLLAGSAASFHYRLPLSGYVLGGLVVVGAIMLTTTLWCIGSWFYNLIFRLVFRRRPVA